MGSGWPVGVEFYPEGRSGGQRAAYRPDRRFAHISIPQNLGDYRLAGKNSGGLPAATS